MIEFVTGDILQSSSECLVNTVNCEGYMGKGIAYQFKLAYPETNRDYIKACKNGSLTTGKLHHFKENGKLIINFPTKNKWREKSKMEYITTGLMELKKLIYELRIGSIAIPPLGCGNGGLNWSEVKQVILDILESSAEDLDIYIYEPSNYFKTKAVEAPKLSSAHLIIMSFKQLLEKFDKLHVHKTAYFMNLYSGENYFNFIKHKYGPYDHTIDVLMKQIKEYQDYYGVETEGALAIAKNTLISKSVKDKLDHYLPYIKQSITLVNSIKTSKELELLSTVAYIVNENSGPKPDKIVAGVKNWSEEKAKKFSEEDILRAIDILVKHRVIAKDFVGGFYILKEYNLTHSSNIL